MPFSHKLGSKNILGSLELDDPIYRIFSYERFEQVVKSKKLTLVTPELWDDPFENFFLKSKVDMGNGEFAGLNEIASRWYGQCWTTEKDSDALWRIYSHTKCGIRVKTTVGKLFSALYKASDIQAGLKYFISKVTYKSQDEILKSLKQTRFMNIARGGQNHGFAELLCIKRTEFEHENEVRILYHNTSGTHNQDKIFDIDFDPNILFEEVCVDPRVNQHTVAITEKKLKAIGLTHSVIKSPLYEFPEIIIQM